MTGIDGTADGLIAGVEALAGEMAEATNLAVVAVAAFARAKLTDSLSGSGGSQGSPPAERTGALVGSVTSITVPSLSGGLAVWTGTTEFYGSFLNAGFHPNGTRRRRSDRERRTLQRTSHGAGKVRYPYIDDVFTAALAEAAVLAADIRLI